MSPAFDPTLYCATIDAPIRDAVTLIDRNTRGIALIVDAERRLLGTITDGDIRRAILDGLSLREPLRRLLERKAAPYARPFSVPVGTDRTEQLRLMQEKSIRQLPLLDEQGRVADLSLLSDLLPEQLLPMKAVVMAGGFGKRMRPLTEELPKPMLPIGDRPLMERIIDQLRDSGIRQVNVTTHFQAEKIKGHFGDGHEFGVEMSYVSEDEPLGTAGSLGLIGRQDDPLLVINGDILTRVDFRDMLKFHRRHQAEMTVGIRQYDLEVPYGVLECDGPRITRVSEKPTYKFFVNAGIYLIEPSALDLIPQGRRYDMTDLIEALIAEGRSVVSFPIMEYWLDIGRPDDYQQAQADIIEREAAK